MKSPININELLERVSGNREFAKLMLENFFISRETKTNLLLSNLEEGLFDELADNVHKIKGVTGNLAMFKANNLLHELHIAARRKDQKRAMKLIGKFNNAILEAEAYFSKNPNLSSSPKN